MNLALVILFSMFLTHESTNSFHDTFCSILQTPHTFTSTLFRGSQPVGSFSSRRSTGQQHHHLPRLGTRDEQLPDWELHFGALRLASVCLSHRIAPLLLACIYFLPPFIQSCIPIARGIPVLDKDRMRISAYSRTRGNDFHRGGCFGTEPRVRERERDGPVSCFVWLRRVRRISPALINTYCTAGSLTIRLSETRHTHPGIPNFLSPRWSKVLCCRGP